MAVTPWSVGTKLVLNKAPEVTRVAGTAFASANRPKPLVLVSGWMGSTSKHLRRFREAYHARGCDVFEFSAGPMEVLKPTLAVAKMEAVMDTVGQELQATCTVANGASSESTTGDSGSSSGSSNDSAAAAKRPLIFHGFSMSGFMWGNALLSMDRDPARFGAFRNALTAQVFDSPPDYGRIAGGVARSMGYGGMRETAIKSVISGYLSATHDSAGVLHRASSARFHGNDLTSTPALFIYSQGDPIAPPEDCKVVIDKWRQQGLSVDELVFGDTPHVQHMLREPDKYLNGLDDFLLKAGALSMVTK